MIFHGYECCVSLFQASNLTFSTVYRFVYFRFSVLLRRPIEILDVNTQVQIEERKQACLTYYGCT